MLILGLALFLLPFAQGAWSLILLSMVMGLAQALAFPATVALVSTQVEAAHLGAGMGLIGMLDNGGKVIGPILGGALITWLDYSLMFQVMGILVWVGAGVVWYFARLRGRPGQPEAKPLGLN